MSGLAPYGVLAYGEAPAYVAPTSPSSQNFALLSPRYSDAATFTASSEVAGLTVSNLQNVQPRKKWRSTAVTPQSIDVDFGTPVAANAMALVGHNLTAAGMVRVTMAATYAGLSSSPAIDTEWVSAWAGGIKPFAPEWPHFTTFLKWSNDSAFQYARVEIADGGAVLTYFEAGRLAIGPLWQPSQSFDFGGTPLSLDSRDAQTITPYGGFFTDRRTVSPARIFELSCYALNKREAFDGLFELQRLRGQWGDVICSLDPGDATDHHRFIMQGAFAMGGAYTMPPAFDSSGQMFGAGIRLREFT